MSFKDNGDLRVRENGWGWFEEELFTVFAPIIGPHGLSVYAALARMIPVAGIDREKPIVVRRVMEWSSVGRSKCAEEMQRVVNMGMVIKTSYLDGRPPTYKLESLKKLAKLGQRELMRRAGYPADAKPPFDQTGKNSREKELRKEREKQEERTHPLPLLDDENESSSSGDRNTDTAPEVPGVEDRVHDADTVSVIRQHSAATRQHVAAGRTPLLKEEEKNREENLKPPYPPAAPGGEVGATEPEDDPDQARPALLAEHCTFVDAAFDRSVPIAAQWVMAQLGLTKRKLVPAIEAQLILYCKNNRSMTLQDAAALMARQSRLLHADADLLRHRPWGWDRWFGEAIWTRPLPYDEARREASTGTRLRTAEEIAAAEYEAGTQLRELYSARLCEKAEVARAWVEARAAEIAAVEDGYGEIVTQLRDAAAEIDSTQASFDAVLNRRLRAICLQLYETAYHRTSGGDLRDLHLQVNEDVLPMRGNPRVPQSAVDAAKKESLRKRLLELHGLPVNLQWKPES